MRNLKKVLSVLLVVAMLATAMVPAFAADTATISADAKIAADLGMLLGTGSGVTAEYTATGLTRVQAAVLLLRLKGLEAEAKAFKTTDNFADVKADAWYAPITAYLKAHPELGFIGDGKNFNAEEPINAQQYYKVVLTALGYEIADGKDSSFEKVLEFAKTKGLVKLDATKKQLTVDDLAVATVEGLKTAVKGGTTTLVATLGAKDAAFLAKAKATGLIPDIKDFELTNKAKSITVTLGAVPADATKVVFTVLKDDAIAIAATFTQSTTNKAEFTYTAASSLLAGTYKVSVKDGDKDLGSKSVTVTDEKIAKIEILSSKIIRSTDTKGTAYYKVSNQYGEDITSLPIAGNLKVSSPFLGTYGTTILDKGIITIENAAGAASADKLDNWGFTSRTAVISIYDELGTVVTKELGVSNTVGDIQSLTIKGIVGNKVIEKNSSDTYYLDFEAKDSSGVLVTDLETLDNKALEIYSAGNLLNVVFASDPSNDKKAAIKITVKGTSDVSPYVGVGIQNITIVSKTGKSASYNAEVKLGAVLNQFILQRPAIEVAEGTPYVEIPFTALDSTGAAVTSYDSIVSNVSISDGVSGSTAISFLRQSDGSAKLFYSLAGVVKDKTITLTAQVKSSYKFSNISFTVKEAAKPTNLTATYDTYLTAGAASEKGYNDIKVTDQFGSTIDLRTLYVAKDGYRYFVFAENKGTTVEVTGNLTGTTAPLAWGLSKIKVTATSDSTVGTSDVVFRLVKILKGDVLPADAKELNAGIDGGLYKEVTTKTITFTKVDPKNISKYEIDVIKPLYASAVATADLDPNYSTTVAVKGYLANGTKVIIPTGIKVTDDVYRVGVLDNSYTVDSLSRFYTVGGKVYAKDTDNATEKGKVTANVRGYNGVIYTVSADITSDDTVPYATTITSVLATEGGIVGTLNRGTITYDANGRYSAHTNGNIAYLDQSITKKSTDVYVVKVSKFNSDIAGKYVANSYVAPVAPYTLNAKADVYFKIVDQYAKEISTPTYLSVTKAVDKAGNALSSSKYTVNSAGLVTAPTLTAADVGDEITITATGNGITSNITLIIVAD